MISFSSTHLSKKPAVWGTIVFASVLLLTQFLSYQRYLINKETLQIELNHELNSVKGRFQDALNYDLSATKTLSFIIERYGVPDNFSSVAKPILESNRNIDALELTRLGKITNVYPTKGNESAIGYDILADPLTKKEALKAIERRELCFAGPLELKQGGLAVIGRLPIFKDNEFWGFSVVIIKVSTLLKVSGIENVESNNYIYQFSKINPNTSEKEYFLRPDPGFDERKALSAEIPEGNWKIYVMPKENRALFSVIAFSTMGAALSVIAGMLIFYLAKQPARLKQLVDQKSSELIATRQDYKNTLERVTDAFISLDKNWCYTFMNKRAGEILGKDPNVMVGVNIWEDFPEAVGLPFYDAYHKAMEEQKYIWMEEYFKPYDLWFENHIYPSPDGLTIYFRDITEKKLNESRIAIEKLLSDTIINSMPGMFYLYDKKGKFARWNKNLEVVTGYSGEEVSTMHPLDFFDAKEKSFIEQAMQSLFTSGNSSIESMLFTKHGSKIPYHFYSQLVIFDGKEYALGMGMDISYRVKAENELKQRTKEIQRLSTHLGEVQEKERIRIGREIHDELGQQLTAIKMDIAWIDKNISDEEKTIKTKLKNVITLLDGSNKSIRRILSELRPVELDHYGLNGAIIGQGKRFEGSTGININFNIAEKKIILPEQLNICIFRVYQESLTNISRYSKANKVNVELTENESHVILAVTDNGIGFNPDEIKKNQSFGILGMRERANSFGGKLELFTSPGKGTKITLTLPKEFMEET